MFKIIILIIVIFALYNLKNIIEKKRKYLLSMKIVNKKAYSNETNSNNIKIKQYSNYLKTIDGFTTFLFMLAVFNCLFAGLRKITNVTIIFMSLIIFLTLIDIVIAIFFKYNDKYESKSKIINIIYYIFIVLMFLIGFLCIYSNI